MRSSRADSETPRRAAAFSVFSDREKGDVEKLLRDEGLEGTPIFLCDATKHEDIARLFEEVGRVFDGQLDGLLHSIAFAKREDLAGEFANTSSDGWDVA